MKKTWSSLFVWCLIAVFATVGFSQGAAFAANLPDTRDVMAKNGVVAAAHPLAAQAGVEILKQGGNAFDAAIATSFMLNVVEPNASGMGGGGFALLYVAKEKKTYMIDYREMAPAKAKPDMYKLDAKGKLLHDASATGFYSTGVPGQLRGMELLHKKFASMNWADLVKPAIAQSEAGLPVSKNLNGILMDELARFDKYSPSMDWFKKVYFKNGLPVQAGDVVINSELTESLRKVAAGGADVFYKGEIADAIDAFYAAKADGWITKADLANYQAKFREPVTASYRGYTLFTSPPPSSGGLTLANMLNIMEGFGVREMGRNSVDFHHAFIETQKLAYADRGRYMADSDFSNVPIKGLADKFYADQRRELINPEKANKSFTAGDPAKYESGSTTSFSVVDKEGNMITVTQTINYFFGSGVVVDGTGIIMNDEMDDFVTNNPKHANAPAPGKRPLSSITPTIVLKDDKPFMTLGTPGGPRIITTVAQIIMNVVDYDMDLQTAITDARMFCPNAPVAQMEKPVTESVIKGLEARGHTLNLRPQLSLFFGGAQGIMILPDGTLHGAGDSRRLGKAFGY